MESPLHSLTRTGMDKNDIFKYSNTRYIKSDPRSQCFDLLGHVSLIVLGETSMTSKHLFKMINTLFIVSATKSFSYQI